MSKLATFFVILICCFLSLEAQVDDSSVEIYTTSNGKEEAAEYSRLLQEYYKRGDYELHKIYSDSLLLISKLYDLKEMGIMALNSQAIYYKNRGERLKAIELYRKALVTCDSVPNNEGPKSMILLNTAHIYTDIGFYQKSIETMDELLVMTDTIKRFSRIKAAALLGQSGNYAQLKDLDKALLFSKRTLEIGEFIQDDVIIGKALNNIGEIYIKTKDYKSALSITKKGLQLKDNQSPTKRRAWLLLNNGIAHYHLSSLEASLSSLQEALEISKGKNIVEIEMYSYEYLAKIFEQQKEFEKSYEAQKEYSRLRERIQEDERKAAIVDLEKDISDTKDTLDAAQEEAKISTGNTKRLILYGSLTVLVLVSFLFFSMKKKKNMEVENRDLQEQYALLKQRIERPTDKQSESIDFSLGQKEPYKNSSLTDTDRQHYKQRILQLMNNKKPYLEPDLKLVDLATKLDMSTAHFSEVLHYCFEENFYNFINFYRVLEAQKLLQQQSYDREKIIAVAFDAGFKSKTTFNRVFKNYTGLTPSEYRQTT